MGGAPQGFGTVEAGMRILWFLLIWAIRPGMVLAQGVGPGVLTEIRAGRWAGAEALAAMHPDPLAQKLVGYYRLLTPGAARAVDIAAFIAANPDWPSQTLAVRLQDALVADADDRAVLTICQQRQPETAPALQRCAEAAWRIPGADAAPWARAAWVRGVDLAAEVPFIRQWGALLTPGDQWQRFDRLAWTDTGAPGGPAARQSQRLAPADRPVAEARLALRRDDPTAPALAAALPGRADPALMLELARWYRRAGLDRAAAQVWVDQGAGAEMAAPPERRGAFWAERNLLGRRLLRAQEDAWALAVVDTPAQQTEAALDSAFLAGWIALRRLNDPKRAAVYFERMAATSHAVITQARAQYWLGRARGGDGFRAASAWPTTYYGQLGAAASGEDPGVTLARIRALTDPAWSANEAASVLQRDTARAAVMLAAWGDKRRARPFLQRLEDASATIGERGMTARLSLSLGLPDQAVALARRAGRDGLVLPDAGWPIPVEPPAGAIEPAVLLGLMRQESSFDDQAVSPSGARGLMQLMPGTAADMIRRIGETVPYTDPQANMRLGTAYLQGLLDQFGALPLALAAYNAGPRRVNEWLTANGDPRTGAVDMVDWIELIPFNETRNYVQRVLENVTVYRARRGGAPLVQTGAPAPG